MAEGVVAAESVRSGLTLEALSPSDPLMIERRSAYEDFAKRPWPRQEDEAWRRTDLSSLDIDRFVLTPSSVAILDRLPDSFQEFSGTQEALALWSQDGFYRRIPNEVSSRGVLFLDLAEAVRRWPDRVRPLMKRPVPPAQEKLASLSDAFWNRGLFVYVPKGVDAGVVLRGGYAPRLADGQTAVSRTVVVVEAGAQVTFLEEYAAQGPEQGEALSVASVDLEVGENAQVTYVNFQRQGPSVNHFLVQNARLGRDARLTTLAAAMGGRLSRSDFGSRLTGPGATANLYGLVFGESDQRFTHHTLQEHQAPRTSSDLLFKSALRDKARSVYTGLIRIEKTAGQSQAYQASKNVLLSRTARANAIPMLEILTDDVKCGHGAAVGGLDDDQRFYLMSRGLSRREAERAMVEGFFEDVIQRVAVPSLHERLRSMIDAKLSRSDE